MVSTLFIFGNGFDLAHGLKTSYKDFFDHLRSSAEGKDLLENLSWFNSSIAKELQKGEQADWCNFEDGFSSLDLDAAKMMNSIYGKSGEDIVTNAFATVKAKLRAFVFHSYYKNAIQPIAKLPRENAYYINFNYTPLLEDAYEIPESRILHIHGDAQRKEVLSLFGLSRDEHEIVFGGPIDTASNLPKGIIRETLIKDTYKLIPVLDTFLRGHPSDPITNIVVFGSSLSKADRPYFYHLLKVYPNCHWTIYIHPEDESGARLRAEDLKREAKVGTVAIVEEPNLLTLSF